MKPILRLKQGVTSIKAKQKKLNLETELFSDLAKLTKDERKIYDSVMRNFPSTKHESALDISYSGGVKWDFIPT